LFYEVGEAAREAYKVAN